MISNNRNRATIMMLFLLLLSQNCTEMESPTPVAPTMTGSAIFPVTDTPQPIGTLAPTTSTPAASSTVLPQELSEALETVVRAIETGQPELLHPLIGGEGVAAAGFAQEGRFNGENNAEEIISAFDEALAQSSPTCEGFVTYIGALPDKAILVYRGLDFDWSHFGMEGTDSDGMTIQLFNLDEGWRLVYVTPFDFETGLSILGELQECPSVR